MVKLWGDGAHVAIGAVALVAEAFVRHFCLSVRNWKDTRQFRASRQALRNQTSSDVEEGELTQIPARRALERGRDRGALRMSDATLSFTAETYEMPA